MKSLTIHYEGKPIYDIKFTNSFDQLPEAINPLNIRNRRICIVSETRVAPLYMNEVKNILQPLAKEVTEFVFLEGEENKNLRTVQQLYEKLILSRFDRKDLLIALGGGVVGDLTGYAAATYLRGIDFIQIPTSLLAQVDSSIGGKTGVDFDSYKNMVGAFHQPKLVYMNFSVLKTLSDRQFASGMGEIIKHGLIKDIVYYDFMKKHRAAIMSRDVDVISRLVQRSCEIKGSVVERDPKEQGERALLNFGHTLGHAIEKLENFSKLHGECVALGMMAAVYICYKRGNISAAMYEDIKLTIQSFDLPIMLDDDKYLNAEDIVKTTKLDKKMESGAIKFILLSPEGCGIVDRTVSDAEMTEAARSIGAV